MGASTNQSGEAWIGVVPERWSVEPLGRWFRERKTTVSDADFAPLSVTMQGIVPQLENVAKTDNNANRKLVLKGDFAINSRSDRKGSAGVSGLDGSVSVITTVLQPRGLDPRFTHHLLRSRPFQEEFYRWGHGIVDDLWSTKWSDMKSIKIPVPPEPEQRAIADYLDRETAQIDAFIAKNEELITLLTERRAAEISLAIAGDWPEVQLRALSAVPIQNGVDAIGDPSNPAEWPRYVRTTDIVNVSSLDPEKRVTIAPDLARSGMVEKDDMLMTRAGATIGKSYLHASGEIASYAGYLVRVRPDRRRVLPWYLAYWTQSQQYLDQIRSGAVVSTIDNFSASKYRSLRVPFPPIEVQADVVDRIRRSSENSDRAIGMAATAIDLARERRAALISAAVTGKIDVGVAA